ncbi:MAG: PDZ domain-containing protein [Planctomycetota bacterium]
MHTLPFVRPARLLSAVLVAVIPAVLPAALLVAGVGAQNPLTRKREAPPAPFAGRFAGDDFVLELRYVAAAKRYVGSLVADGESMACEARAEGERLLGRFRVDDEDYEFTATLAGDVLQLRSDGETVQLKRVAAGGSKERGEPVEAPTPRGGVGIALAPTKDGGFRIEQVAPGGPAARAKLTPGGTLRAVDGESVEGLTLEAVVAKVSGPIGKLVRLTVETPDEILEVMLERADLSRLQAGERGEDASSLPATGALTSGTRVTWYLGSATLSGVSSQLVQNDKGEWVDPGTGRRYSDERTMNTGGAGYLQMTILAADEQGLAVDTRNFLMLDPAGGRVTSSTVQGMVGDASALGDYWVHPQRLATMAEVNEGGHRVVRLRYPVEGVVYDAIAIETRSASGWFRNTYDTATGLLIAGSSSTTGSGVATIDPSGRVSGGAGATTITSSRLMNVRRLDLPWAGDRSAPPLRVGQQMRIQGTYSTRIPGVPEMPMEYSAVSEVQRVERGFALCRIRSRLTSGYSAPQESETWRVYGTPMTGGAWVPPAVLAALSPQQAIDHDPITGFRVSFVGVDGNRAVFVEHGPRETNHYAYDLGSGLLVGAQLEQSNDVSTTVLRASVTSGN